MVNYLNNNWITILLIVALAFMFWRNNSIQFANRDMRYEVLKDATIKNLKDIEVKVEEIKIKSTADSIARNEVVKNLPKYENNLSITRLKFIRDSLRARHAMLNK